MSSSSAPTTPTSEKEQKEVVAEFGSGPIPTGRLFDNNGPPRHKYFYIERWILIFLIVVVKYTSWKPTIDATSEHHTRLAEVARIDEPWSIFAMMGSLGADNSDVQFESLKDNLVLLTAGLFFYVVLSRGIRSLIGPFAQMLFRLGVGLAVIYYAHGTSIIFVLSIVVANFYLIKLHRFVNGRILFTLMWVGQVALLIIIDKYKNRNLFLDVFGGFREGGNASLLGDWLHLHQEGIMRWSVLFNLSTLRMLSYNYDYYEASYYGGPARDTALGKHKKTCVDCALQEAPCYKLRSDCPHPVEKYHLLNYLTYMFYTPLYLAGPMSSFNAFISHSERPQVWMGTKELMRYAFAVARLYFSLEVFIHFVHFNAIRAEMQTANSILYPQLTIGMGCSLTMPAMAFLWLKFSFIWKFFRCVALADGIDVPEDMSRCFSNVCTIADFWQSWHASFNVWLVRYMYIPLGGAKTKFFSIWVIFGFIAIWHDVELHLLTWAGVMCCTMMVEGVGIAVCSNPKYFGWFHRSAYWRLWRTIGAFGSCLALLGANYVGFGGGGSMPRGEGGRAAGEHPNSDASLAWGPISAVISIPMVFLLCAGVGVILRQNDKHRQQFLKARFFKEPIKWTKG